MNGWARARQGASLSNRSDGARAADSAPDSPRSEPSAPIDRAYLARFTLGNVELEREVLGLFAGQAVVTLRDVRQAQTSKAWRQATHTLKGSAAAIGASRLVRLADLAERLDIESPAAKSGRLAEKAVAALEEAVEEACRYARQLCA